MKAFPFIFSILFFSCSIGHLNCQIYQLDFGNYPEDGYEQITTDHKSDDFKWEKPPVKDFYHPQYNAWRFPTWLDGVIAPSLQWSMPLPNGHYEIQLMLENGFELTSSWKVQINGEDRDLRLHTMRDGAEPPEKIEPTLKIWYGEVEVMNGQLDIALTGGRDSIRLLAAHIFSIPQNKGPFLSPEQHWLLDMLTEYGQMSHRPMPLEPMIDNLQTALLKKPQDVWAFKYYWDTRYVHLAEELEAMRGWQWSTNRLRLSMIRKYQQGVMLLDPIVQQTQHPLYERALWLRARLLYHLYYQYRHEPEGIAANKDLALLQKRYPQDTLLRMYLGELFPNQDLSTRIHPAAPEWSKKQVEALNRLRKLVYYWVQERQAPNGEMGGKYGDDVEALRFWYPLFYLGDSIAQLGLKRLANGVWNSNKIKDGFAKDVSDVEHASEFISDTAPLLFIASDDSTLHRRALPTAKHMDTLWTQKDPNGDLFFRSSWYSSSAMDERPPRNRDLPFNTRTTKVMRYWTWRYPYDIYIPNLLHQWTNSWAKLSQRTDKGKPKGLLPVSYRASDGKINGDEPNWYEANMFWDYYNFESTTMMLDQMLFLSQHTKDPSLLTPVEDAIHFVSEYKDKGGPEGSIEWSAAQYTQSSGFWSVAGQWRLLLENKQYDDLFREYGSPYLRYRIFGEEDALLRGLDKFNEAIGYNWPMQTSDTWFTDRIFAAHPTKKSRINTDILKAMLTGDIIKNGTSPYMVVTWEKVQPGFTALVKDNSENHLHISIFNHASTPQEINLRPWNLSPGLYNVYLNGKKEMILGVTKSGQPVSLNIPNGVLVELEIKE